MIVAFPTVSNPHSNAIPHPSLQPHRDLLLRAPARKTEKVFLRANAARAGGPKSATVHVACCPTSHCLAFARPVGWRGRPMRGVAISTCLLAQAAVAQTLSVGSIASVGGANALSTPAARHMIRMPSGAYLLALQRDGTATQPGL